MKTLHEIGLETNTDKATYHKYTTHYAQILESLRGQNLTFLELGWGGYDDPNAGGESANMWREYAPNWEIVVVDLFDKNHTEGVNFRLGSQDDVEFLNRISKEFDGFDIIIDDASHVMAPTLVSLSTLWSSLRSGGWYFIEDLGTSYLPEYGAGSNNITVVNHLKNLVDSVMQHDYISQIQFSKSLVAIQKG